MVGYRVRPEGVTAVLGAVVTSAEPIGTAVQALPGEAQIAATGASSAIVGAALDDAFAVLGGRIRTVQARIPSVLQGTAQAGRAVLEGDDAMATQILGLATGALSETDALRQAAHGARQVR